MFNCFLAQKLKDYKSLNPINLYINMNKNTYQTHKVKLKAMYFQHIGILLYFTQFDKNRE